MTTYEEVIRILEDINAGFQGIKFLIFHGNHEGRIWVQVGTKRVDAYDSDKEEIGKGGKAYISNFATDDEIVKKVFGLCLAYVEHETREFFEYKGVKLFNPHIRLDAMMSIAKKTGYRQRS